MCVAGSTLEGGSPLPLVSRLCRAPCAFCKGFSVVWEQVGCCCGVCFPRDLLGRSPCGWCLLRHGSLRCRLLGDRVCSRRLLGWRDFTVSSPGFVSRTPVSTAQKTHIESYLRRFELLNGFNSCVSGPFISAAVFSPSRKETFFVKVVRAVVARQAPPIQLLPP